MERMIFALEFCINHPETFLEFVPEDYEDVRIRFPFQKRRKVAEFFGFDPASLKALEKVSRSAILKGYLKTFRSLYSISSFRKPLHHLSIINEFILDFLSIAQKKSWKGKWDIPLLTDLAVRFENSDLKLENCDEIFQVYYEVKKFSPYWKVRSLDQLYRLEKEMISKLQREVFVGPDLNYPLPPIDTEDWLEPIHSRKELFLESKSQHNCIFSYDKDIVDGKYYIYRIFTPERCTLSLFHINGDWYLDQVFAAFNKKANAATMKKIEAWRIRNGIFVLGDAFRLGIPPDWIFAR